MRVDHIRVRIAVQQEMEEVQQIFARAQVPDLWFLEAVVEEDGAFTAAQRNQVAQEEEILEKLDLHLQMVAQTWRTVDHKAALAEAQVVAKVAPVVLVVQAVLRLFNRRLLHREGSLGQEEGGVGATLVAVEAAHKSILMVFATM